MYLNPVYKMILSVFLLTWYSPFLEASDAKLGYPLTSSNVAKYDLPRDVGHIGETANSDGAYFNPVDIFAEGLTYYNHFLISGDERSLVRFKAILDWALVNASEYSVDGVPVCAWMYTNPLRGSGYNLREPWPSAMAQGYGLAIIALGIQEIPSRDLSDLGSCVLNSFLEDDHTRGGVLDSSLPFFWVDEYPSNPRRHVLNGYIFALAGVDLYGKITGDKDAIELFRRGFDSLEYAIPLFYAPFNSWYEFNNSIGQRSFATQPGYHELHLQATCLPLCFC